MRSDTLSEQILFSFNGGVLRINGLMTHEHLKRKNREKYLYLTLFSVYN